MRGLRFDSAQGLARTLAAVALALAFAACSGELDVVDSPTQITVRIASADRSIQAGLTHLRVSAALHESDGSWKRAVSATFDRSELRWPVDIPITPRVPADANKEFEVIVQALSGPTDVVAETRAVTSFRRNKRVVLSLALYTCAGPTPDEACADPGCQGASCNVCKAEGCVPVGVTNSSELPESEAPQGDAGSERDGAIREGGVAADADDGDDAAGTEDAGAQNLDAGETSVGADARPSGPVDAASADADAGGMEAGTVDGSSSQSEATAPLCTTASCSDGRACNGVEVCNPTTGCQPGTPDNGSDDDGDGYSDAQGDCNDCVADINPSAAEMGNNSVDEDCDTLAPAVVPSCDGALSLTSPDSLDAARALGLCKVGIGIRWGATAAAYVQPNGMTVNINTAGYGLLRRFGANNPREGSAMLALSSGAARAPGDPGYTAPRPGLQKGYTSAYVPGLSTTTRHCNAINFAQPYDGAAFQMTIKVPSNADRMAFDFAFFSTDWISGMCNAYNDQFAVTMKVDGSSAPAINLAPDELGDVMSVNSQFMAACTCPTAPACSYSGYDVNCSLGADSLAGTGFQTGELTGHSHGGTGWLTTSVPVTPGSSITVTALIYDSGDGTYDSLALLDAFRFYRAPAGDGQTAPLVRRAQ